MNASDISNLVLTIVLGLLSIGLGLFAIWLSIQFNNKSTSALDAIKELANEIRTLSQTNVSQQKDFSSKMLDSILAQNRYGKYEVSEEVQKSTALEDVVKRQLEETETRITSAVEQTVRTIAKSNNDPDALQTAIETIRSDIRMLTNRASAISSSIELPEQLKTELDRMRRTPAFYVLLAAIIRENISSLNAMEAFESKYNFPDGWEDGPIETLISRNFLTGSPDDFKVTPQYQAPLAAFIDKNWLTITKLIEHYGSQENRFGLTKEELLMAKELDI